MTGTYDFLPDDVLEDLAKVNPAEDEPAESKEAPQKKRGEKQADRLIKISLKARLFHKPDSTAYADIDINGHRETWPVRSKGFRQWLVREYYLETKSSPGAQATQDALTIIESRARFDAPEMAVYVRIASLADKIYIDLADPDWRAVEIDPEGWRIISAPPVRFRRTSGMKPLPEPATGGSIAPLRQFINVKSDNDFILTVAWILAAMRGKGPYPILSLAGEQGSAKSTFSAILRCLIDPNTAPLRALPREDRDLFIAANNAHALAFDNLSGIPDWIADTLCRLATGGGFAARQLYSDDDETLFDAARPIILNGIEDVITRGDLADRTIFQLLDPIPEESRKTEEKMWEGFRREHPGIFGALLNASSCGLRMLPQTKLERLPRMADFALWATACEPALWKSGAFGKAYQGNRDDAVAATVDASVVGSAVRDFMSAVTIWEGTATDLLGALTGNIGETRARAKEWPKTANTLSGRLRRAAPNLRKLGVDIVFNRGCHGGPRIITITRMQREGVSETSSPSSPSSQGSEFNGLDGDDTGDDHGAGDDLGVWAGKDRHHVNTLKTNNIRSNGDDGDDGDANFHTSSKSHVKLEDDSWGLDDFDGAAQ